MLETLTRQPEDQLLSLGLLFRQDPNPAKVDLGIGVYRDAKGRTPVFDAVKGAERLLLDNQETKAYVGPEGDLGFVEAFWEMIAGSGRVAAGMQTVGGTGALRLAAELLKRSGCRRILLGVPTWINHAAIFQAAGLEVVTFPFFDTSRQDILADRMIDALEQADEGDAVLFHACCHNPTGAVMSDELWNEATGIIVRKGILPLIDTAYPGFGLGLNADTMALRRVLDAVPEAIITASASKSFGLYRERTGAIYVTSESPDRCAIAKSHLVSISRTSYSMPPDHGAAVVRTILTNDELRETWLAELESARLRIIAMRTILATALSAHSNIFGAIATQQGMFSLLPLSEQEVLRLRREKSIYMPLSGRINIAGLNTAQAATLTQSLVQCARFAA